MTRTLAVLISIATVVLAQVRPIRDVRQNDSQGVPVLEGESVRITGVVTEAGHFGYYGPVFVEDTTGGVMLNGPNAASGIAIGDSITVSGTVVQFAGRTQIEDFSIDNHGSGHNLQPMEFEVEWIDDIDTAAGYVENEGWFIRIDSVEIAHSSGERFGEGTYDITDPRGKTSRIYIDEDASELMGMEIPDGSVELTGLVSQHIYDPPHFGGYQVMPRMAADLGVPIQFTPIADAIVDANGDGYPDRWGQAVVVTGVVTVPSGIFNTEYLDVYVQDATAGVNVFDWDIVELEVGDSVMVSGEVDWYRGKTEISGAQVTVLAEDVQPPAPRVLTCAEFNSEAYEGELIILSGITTLADELAGNEDYPIEDGTGSATMRIDADTDIPGLRPLTAPDTFTVVGIKSQFTDSGAPLSGYQFLPRFRTDFSRTADDREVITIAEAQEPGTDGVTPRLLDSVVRIRGRLTGPASVFTVGTAKSLYVEDETQGVNVYGCSFQESEAAFLDSTGVEWEVTGTVTEYNGLTEIANGNMRVSDPNPEPVAPRLLPYSLPLNENMESNLLMVVGEVVEPPSLSGGGYNLSIKSGSAVLAIRIGENTGIAVSRIGRGSILRVVGIGGQYDYEEPFNNGYQLLPRFSADVRDTSGAFVLADRLVIDSISPNPFSPGRGEVAGIALTAPSDSRVTVTVLDMDGRVVKELLRESTGRMSGPLFWDGTSDLARPQPAGIYLLNVKAVRSNGKTETVTQPIVIALRME